MVILRSLASLNPYLSLTRLLTVSWMSSRTPRSCLDDLRSSLDCAVSRLNWRRAESRSCSLLLELDMAELGLESRSCSLLLDLDMAELGLESRDSGTSGLTPGSGLWGHLGLHGITSCADVNILPKMQKKIGVLVRNGRKIKTNSFSNWHGLKIVLHFLHKMPIFDP